MSNTEQADIELEKKRLAEVDEEWKAAAGAGDIERALSYWSDDATVFAPGAPPIVGKDAIRAFVTGSFQIPGFSIRWVTEHWCVARAGV